MSESNSAKTPLRDVWQSLKGWRPSLVQWLTIALVIAIIAVLTRYESQISELGRFRYLGIFVISMLGNVAVGTPAPLIAAILAIAATLNVWLASFVAGLGSGCGEMLGYVFGYSTHTNWNFTLFGYKLGNKEAVESELTAKAWYARLMQLINGRAGALILFVLAVIPNPFFDVGGILAGVAKMPWWLFFSVTTLGKTARYLILLTIVQTSF